ncbi:GIY-YIG nuclease family protein [Streptomyces triticirhizae]|uniref:GIY-YIG nuclease family protein n=1 Tax=Streptomyces triticirhizae TaxID=2483353 RepID=A0A3M2M9T0_9ACTN|nr:GIY-YIG nuclease family protein [Streptomyces triticirhizae]RMI43888.1 GIY-YIG nuclease family protein [Streptomyces triticirhizae]
MASQFSSQFRLSITRALGHQLAEAFDELAPAPLTPENLDRLDEQAEAERLSSRSGVYQLYRRGEFVYVGKADKRLSGRLSQHLRKISGRSNISPSEISFKCLYVAEDFSAVAPEKLLIKKYKADGHIPWNTNGFGNKDPGQRRDRTALSADHFDALFPIDLDRQVDGLGTGEHQLADLLAKIKSGLPYNFRFQKDSRFDAVSVTVPSAALTADAVFRLVAPALPEDWQISALMGYVIMYPDKGADYPSGFRYYRGVTVTEEQPKRVPAGEAGTLFEDEDEDEDEEDPQ